MHLRVLVLPLVIVTLLTLSAGASDYTWSRVAKAEPDECYNGFGQPYLDITACNGTGTPKRNHTYPWGTVLSGKRVWIGTAANMTQIARGAVGQASPLDTPTTVAEYEASQFPGVPSFARGLLGDWRPPQVWVYDTETEEQTNVTPDDPLLESTLGLRSAGANKGVVILAGPQLFGIGINLFAFDAETLEYLGSKTLWRYSNIRRWVVAKGVLYTGVQDTAFGGGTILRWRGSRRFPFSFDVVGRVDNDVANLAVHEGRLFAGTWPASSLSSLGSLGEFLSGEGEPASLWMSPPLSYRGLSRVDSWKWSKVWSVADYEPDPVIMNSYGIGEIASYEGCLWWGTMNPPFSGFGAISRTYGAPQDIGAAMMFSNRATAVFRGKSFGKRDVPPTIELLYGEETLPVYSPPTMDTAEMWTPIPNRMGLSPLYGASGFDNSTNYYFWSLGNFAGGLFVGLNEFSPFGSTGADLWVFPDASTPAVLVSDTGLTTPLNEGFRNMVVTAEALYIAATNGANVSPDGGWELIRLVPSVD